MSEVNETAEAVMDSLTGHDEMAIAQHFGFNVAHLVEKDELLLARALVFVTKRRVEGVNDDDARNAALDMTFKEVTSYFVAAGDEAPEVGKDVPESEPQPATSPTSVS